MPRKFNLGDWYCKQCHDHQFARNLFCRICGAPTPFDVPWTPRDDALPLPHIQAAKIKMKSEEKLKIEKRKEKKRIKNLSL